MRNYTGYTICSTTPAMRQCDSDAAIEWVYSGLVNLKLSTGHISLVSQTFTIRSAELVTNIPVSWGYHCTVHTACDKVRSESDMYVKVLETTGYSWVEPWGARVSWITMVPALSVPPDRILEREREKWNIPHSLLGLSKFHTSFSPWLTKLYWWLEEIVTVLDTCRAC